MIEVVRYTEDKKDEWDEYVRSSDIPVFMFERNYMEYHAERFHDYSLMIFVKKKLLGIIPAHLNNSTWSSHRGLTFGGLISKTKFHYEVFIAMWNEVISFLRNADVEKIVTKNPPVFYLKSGSMASDFFLQQLTSYEKNENLGAYIDCRNHTFPKSSIEKRKLNLELFYYCEEGNLHDFWPILEKNLQTFHNIKPVHSLNEIEHLRNYFPNNIQLLSVRNKLDKKIDAATLVYDTNQVLKMQYIATSERGRTNRAIHALYFSVISKYKKSKSYIDIGSCMDNGKVNTKLLYLKERFGATTYFSNTYSIKL